MAMTWLTLTIACLCFAVCVAAPSRLQFLPESSSPGPAVVTGGSEVWDDTDDFDLDGDEDWLGEPVASPSTIPLRQDYDEYDDDDDSSKRDDDVDRQDAEEEEDPARRNPEFLFVPSSDSRLMLQDDDADQSGLIKVRHTGKNAYSEVDSNSLDEESSSKDEDDDQFEFTLGGDDDDKDDENDLEKDDFVLEDAQPRDIAEENVPRRLTHYDDDEQSARRGTPDDDGDDDDEEDEDDPAVFESPEEDSQVIYGDHVFLY